MNDSEPTVPVSRQRDKDMQGAPAALVRAARRAREIAARTGTPLIVVEDGRVVEKMVSPETDRSSSEGQGRSGRE